MKQALVRTTLSLILTAVCSQAYTQTFPADLRGSWFLQQQLDDIEENWSGGSCIINEIGRKQIGPSGRIQIGDKSIKFNAMTVPRPKLAWEPAATFAHKHLRATEPPLKVLGIDASRIEVITRGDPRNSAYFNFLIVKDQNTLIVARCGLIYLAVREAPP